MKAAELTAHQHNVLQLVERVCSGFSLAGCFFIMITFLGSKAFHKPINRLVFFASVGNILSNVATLIARSAVNNVDSVLCQFQAFLIQMFIPADAYWTLAMALNVYLTFYWKFDAERLRKLEIYYFLLCYGIPFIPAFIYIWAKTGGKGRIYGNATLWCWVDSDWDTMRIATFYGPVWVVILITTSIYIRAGREIYVKRKQLRNFSIPPPIPIPIIHDPFTSVKTTEVFVTSEKIELGSSDSIEEEIGNQAIQHPKSQNLAPKDQVAYTVTVSSNQSSSHRLSQYPDRNSLSHSLVDDQPPPQVHTRFSDQEMPINRHDSTIESRSPKGSVSMVRPVTTPTKELSHQSTTRRYAVMEVNNAAWSYARVAVLFFVAMMVTWIPSSANRVYSVIHPGEISLVLEFASAFVLPLQGFWNAVIYTTTSLRACKIFWRQLSDRRGLHSERQSMSGAFAFQDRPDRFSSRASRFNTETESMAELASRPTSEGR